MAIEFADNIDQEENNDCMQDLNDIFILLVFFVLTNVKLIKVETAVAFNYQLKNYSISVDVTSRYIHRSGFSDDTCSK